MSDCVNTIRLQMKGICDCSLASSQLCFDQGRTTETPSERENRIDQCLNRRQRGDMIQIKRKPGFLHYVIYIGLDKIVDFVKDKGGDVCQRDLYETVACSDCKIDNYLDDPPSCSPLAGEEIVKRALMEIVERRKSYDIHTYNCEHFATWCRYDKEYCHQSSRVLAFVKNKIASSV